MPVKAVRCKVLPPLARPRMRGDARIGRAGDVVRRTRDLQKRVLVC